MIKSGIRSIGIDDAPFKLSQKTSVPVIGVVYQGGTWFDGILTTRIRKDGWNSTDKLLSMLNASKFLDQLHYIMLDGIALGGFNIVDIHRLHQETGLKVLTAIRRKPDLKAMYNALEHLSQPEKRRTLLERAGPIHKVENIYCQLVGMDQFEAKHLIRLTATRSHLPEPLRIAHLIARAMVHGESGNRA